MRKTIQRIGPWPFGVAMGAVAFGLICLQPALASVGKEFKVCEAGETKMCDKSGNGLCAKNSDVAKKLESGYTIPSGGACPQEPPSPN